MRHLALVATLLVAACAPVRTGSPVATGAAAPTEAVVPSPTVGPVAGSLGEALAFASVETSAVLFTDWSAIKAANGAPNLTGARPIEEKLEALRTLTGTVDSRPSDATPAGFAVRFLSTNMQFTYWGFDILDIDWEVKLFSRAVGEVWVLRLRDGFDVGPLVRHLDEYGYASDALPHGTLRTIEGFVSNTFVDGAGRGVHLATTTEIGMGTIGLLDDGRTLVLGWTGRQPDTSREAVRSILTGGPPDSADLSFRSVARLLDAPTAAIIDRALSCNGLGAARGGGPNQQAKIDAALSAAGPLEPWNAIGVGYDRADEPIGRFVIGYADAGSAERDLGARQTLAVTGPMLDGQGVYADHLTLAGARALERSIVLDVEPRDSSPTGLFRLVVQRDLLFASCSA